MGGSVFIDLNLFSSFLVGKLTNDEFDQELSATNPEDYFKFLTTSSTE
jgi:hypothetical protein